MTTEVEHLATRTLTAVRVGTGPDLVILHSLLTDRTAFDSVLSKLAAAHRVTLVNLPGFHGSKPVAAKLEAYVDRVREAFDSFGITKAATLMGNGFGGTLALAFALNHLNRLARLILVDVAATFPEGDKQAFRVMAEKVRMAGMGAIADIAAARVYHTGYIAKYPHAVEERRKVLLGVDPAAFIAACEVLIACDLAPLLSSLRLPILVVYGALDEATPPHLNSVIAAASPNARAIAIPECGHCPPLEMPQTFLNAIGDSISTHG